MLGVLPAEKYSDAVHTFYMNSVQPRRLHSRLKVKKIFAESARGEKRYIEKGARVKYIPYNSPITMNIIEDLTILEIFSSEIIMITIESKEIAQSFIGQFDIIWKGAGD